MWLSSVIPHPDARIWFIAYPGPSMKNNASSRMLAIHPQHGCLLNGGMNVSERHAGEGHHSKECGLSAPGHPHEHHKAKGRCGDEVHEQLRPDRLHVKAKTIGAIRTHDAPTPINDCRHAEHSQNENQRWLFNGHARSAASTTACRPERRSARRTWLLAIDHWSFPRSALGRMCRSIISPPVAPSISHQAWASFRLSSLLDLKLCLGE